MARNPRDLVCNMCTGSPFCVLMVSVYRSKRSSSGAHASEMLKQQDSTRIDAVHNGRPLRVFPTCIAIYHPVFTQFANDVAAPDLPVAQEELIPARNLIAVSSEFYKNQSDRHFSMAKILEQMLKREVLPYESTFRTGKSYCKPGGHRRTKCLKHSGHGRIVWAFDLLVEWTLDYGEGARNPVSQAECVYVALCSTDEVSYHSFQTSKISTQHQAY